ncbi:MAG TPA: hypothetical protein VFC01_22530, partial [Mycobacterium sp.]|nr:hypothetical protein [Mycobacterium sp.]
MITHRRPAGIPVWLGMVALVGALVAPHGFARADTQSCTSEMGGVEIDGNLVADAPGKYDWFGPAGQGFLQTGASCGQPIQQAIIGNLAIKCISPMVRDDCNAGGSKDASVFGSTADKNNSCLVTGLQPWQCKTGDVPQKNDLTEAYAAVFQDQEPTSPTFGDHLLFVAVGHRSTDGDNHLDFEFNQAGVTTCINGVIVGGPGTELTGGRTLGDFIVSVDFSGGGNNGQVSLRTWEANAGAPCGYAYSNPIPDQLGPLGFACTNTNPLDDKADVPVTAPCQAWQPSSQCQLGANYETRQFIEVIVNLSDAGVFDDLVCGANSTLMYKSRSAPSFTAELKDFIRTEFQILPPPPCAIVGPDSVCPGATAQFCGPDGFIYSWTATGATIISGDPTAQCVTVQAGSTCGSYTVELTVSDATSCSGTCEKTVNVTDTSNPVLVGVPTGGDLGCNPTPPSCATVTATDDCDASPTVTCVPGTITGTCNKSQTFTYTATDDCGNSAVSTATYTWKEDTTNPVLVGVPTGGDLGCNPTPPTCGNVTATDNCDGTRPVTCTPGTITGECLKSQTFTYSAVDLCGNSASSSATYTWKEDTTNPVLVGVPAGGDLGCNPTLPTCA